MRYALVVAVGLLLQGAVASGVGSDSFETGTIVVVNESGVARVLEIVGTDLELKFRVDRRVVLRGLQRDGFVAACVDRGSGFALEASLPLRRRVVWTVGPDGSTVR